MDLTNKLNERGFLEQPKDIKAWLDSVGVENYTLRYDEQKEIMVVDVKGVVNLYNRLDQLTQIPVQFGEVSGYFYCNNNQLISLSGAPQSVDGSFSCSNNQLASLAGAPQSVGGDCDFSNNQITTLAGAPQSVGGNFYATINPLTSLDGMPDIGGDQVRFPAHLGALTQDAKLGQYKDDSAWEGYQYIEVNGNDAIKAYVAAVQQSLTQVSEPSLASIHSESYPENAMLTAIKEQNFQQATNLFDQDRSQFTVEVKEALVLSAFDPRINGEDRNMAKLTLDYIETSLKFDKEREQSLSR